MNELNIPGTVMPYAELKSGAFSLFEPMLAATGGLALSQVCAITGLESSTVQNWVKRGWVAKPTEKKYHERQLARILIINALRDSMQLDMIAGLLGYINGSVEDKSDDIIKESELYDYLCVILLRLDGEDNFSDETVCRCIKDEIKNYVGPYYDSPIRLFKALRIMVYAYTAGRLKRRTDLLYKELIN